ncbi:sn-glycerol-1-phosphate dehydrogenase [Zongyangia hominis]|uniref:Sn-glycerol-1-phosphate dehydrogenase n=1 Tax=Zongyangia hominis TaxID=2763677 RepID=A0A926EBV6_9FIRM|nr:sn-glycerol-1-phosphate dehydrogenase [Zongyangia hominis]MBC8569379.1 sn-glycerol-1-phosphate dehydrogenase [Zongyangia hominis]
MLKIVKQLQRETCDCGKEHSLTVKEILLESGAIYKLKNVLEKVEIDGNGCIVCDRNTDVAAGSAVSQVLNSEEKIVIDLPEVHADEQSTQFVFDRMGDADYLVAVGSGTIHDITRYCAHARGIPFISVPTAASVDGFVSTVCAMTFRGAKVTTPGVAPAAVVADTDIFSSAPKRLTASGVGDIIGKYTALTDWRISHLVTGEYLCEKVYGVMEKALGEAVGAVSDIARGKPAACEKLMYGLLLSGVAMQMIGNSRPASGAEHHLSHLWETAVINEPTPALHGEKVGVATALVSQVYHEIASGVSLQPVAYEPLSDREIDRVFKDTAPDIRRENGVDMLLDVDFHRIAENYEEIKALISKIPQPGEIRELLGKVGAPRTLSDIELPDAVLEDSLTYSPFIRRRLTLMRLKKLFCVVK